MDHTSKRTKVSIILTTVELCLAEDMLAGRDIKVYTMKPP